VGRVGERRRRGGEETINSEVRAERVIRVNMVWEVIRLQYVTNFEPLYRIRTASVPREWNECTKAKRSDDKSCLE